MAKTLRGLTLPLLLFLLLASVAAPIVKGQPIAWINEFHYDNAGSDTGEFVEIAVKDPDNLDLSQLTLTLYNGSNGAAYDTHTLDSFVEGETSGDFTLFSKSIAGIQNGPSDGLSLDYGGTLIQFISYEGQLTASGGPADATVSEDIGVVEVSSGSAGTSLQLTGTGLAYSDFAWAAQREQSVGNVNADQFLHPTVQLASNSLSVSEDHGTVTVTATISKPDGSEVSAELGFLTGPSSAVSGDFTGALSKTITFPSDAADGAAASASFTLSDDEEYEGREEAIFVLTNLSTSGTAQIGSPTTFELTIIDNDEPDVVINEILADPDGDIDGNGSTNGTSDDEFVEILNNETREVDISGWTFSDNGTDIRHTFPAGTVIPSSSALVLFSRDSDGDPVGVFGGAVVQSSDLSLSLNNAGDTPTLRDAAGNVIDSQEYGSEGGNNESLVRDPDGTGSMVGHASANGSGGNTSTPGTKIDGTNFTTSLTIQGRAGWRLLSAPVDGMTIADILDDIPIQGYTNHNQGEAKNFYVGYDGSAFTAAGDLDKDVLTPGNGFLLYLFNNAEAGSVDLPVTLDVTTGSKHNSDVNVSLHSSGDGWNLLGNPFETAIDISNIADWANGGSTGLAGGTGLIWDSKNDSYILTTTQNDRVASWQGFFIQNEDATDIDIPISAKTTGTKFYKEAGQKGYLALTLHGTHPSTGERTTDKSTVLYFHPEATHEWDQFDVTKLLPLKAEFAILNIISTKDNTQIAKAQDSRPYDFDGEISFDMQMDARGISGRFELAWARENLPDTWQFTLTDHVAGTQIDMNSTDSYTFTHDIRQRSTSAGETGKMERALPAAITAGLNSDEEPRFTVKVSGSSRTEEQGEIPQSVKLNQNYPNPFNPNTTISYELTEQAEVSLNIYTIVGQKVATLVDGSREAGVHQEVWNATDMPSGIYIAQLEVNGKVFIRKMTLIK